ncbi:MAG: hypothetical protein QOH15_2070 [Gaiellales bacterium]|jgi:hypothetical protein|nr:hypothetical protein [Gaiellales bacterium]
MSDQWPPITVRHVQAALLVEGCAHAVAREHVTRALGVSERELDLLLAEPCVLDVSAYAYLAEFDLERSRGDSLDAG